VAVFCVGVVTLSLSFFLFGDFLFDDFFAAGDEPCCVGRWQREREGQ
jgi:hypothetical protein